MALVEITQETRILMKHVLAAVGLLCGLPQLALGADRLTEVEKLVAEYEAAEKKFFEAPLTNEPTTAEKIRHFKAWPSWRYIPRFVELAEAKPDGEG